MKDQEYYRRLVRRYKENKATDEELEVFADLLEKGELDTWMQEAMNEEAGIEADGEAGYNRFPRRFPAWPRYAAAAAVILLLTGGGLHFFLDKQPGLMNPAEKDTVIPHETSRFGNDIAPGSNKARLTLADGSTIILDEAGEGVLAKVENTTIRKEQDGQVTYQLSGKLSGSRDPVSMNTLSTPRGGQYQLVLPDGTKVWLNAASSITYPAAFNGDRRKVEVSGEVYFEVSENKQQPFQVAVNGMTVTVLGTHFNIDAYPDEPAIKTTLLEGAVTVNSGNKSVQLAPAQQAELRKRGGQQTPGIRVTGNIDTEKIVAWKNGYFMFADEPIESIMRKVSRWYDVDIEYRGDLSGKAVWGTVSRFEKASEILEMLELTGIVRFKIEERRIIVMP